MNASASRIILLAPSKDSPFFFFSDLLLLPPSSTVAIESTGAASVAVCRYTIPDESGIKTEVTKPWSSTTIDGFSDTPSVTRIGTRLLTADKASTGSFVKNARPSGSTLSSMLRFSSDLTTVPVSLSKSNFTVSLVPRWDFTGIGV